MTIIDPVLLLAFRLKGRCEWCGKYGAVDPHHLWCRGMGGGSRLDVSENLIALCRECHGLVHAGQIVKADLLAVVAAREHCTQDDLVAFVLKLKKAPRRGIR